MNTRRQCSFYRSHSNWKCVPPISPSTHLHPTINHSPISSQWKAPLKCWCIETSLQKKWIFQYLAVLLNPASVQCHCSIYVFAAMQLIVSASPLLQCHLKALIIKRYVHVSHVLVHEFIAKFQPYFNISDVDACLWFTAVAALDLLVLN